jgi:hypothetical protein
MRAFEEHSATRGATNGVADTQALKDATVIVLSANGDFTNERLLQVGDGIDIEITDTAVRLSVKDVARTQDHGVTFVPPGEVVLFLPSGRHADKQHEDCRDGQLRDRCSGGGGRRGYRRIVP